MRIQESTSADEQPTWRYWGEEKVDGAIYTVYLKKVRYHTPTKSVSVDTEDDISHLEWETVRVRFIKAGTLGRLVESLASDTGELESTYISVFLATYRTFSSPKQVLNLLIERYEFVHNCGQIVEEKPNNSEVTTSSPPPPPTSTPRIRDDVRDQHCKTLRLALHVWLDQFPEDFRDPPNYPCLSQLESFCQKIMPGSELDEKVRRKGVHIRRPPPPPPPSSLCSLPPPGLDHKISKNSRHKSPPPLVLKSSHTSQLGCGTGSSIDRSASPLPPPALASRGGSHGGSGGHGPATGSNGAPPLPPKPANRNGLPVAVYTDILDIPDQIFAQQLTRMDCELFKRVIPHQCLGSVWSRRDKSSRDRDAATVVATVDQFNAVSFRVISTILMVSGHSNGHSHLDKENYKASQHRARVMTKWVDIAQELRVLKNFSSLKAIISGLQSNPIYRLPRSWSHVPKDKLQIYEELARIFSEENNALAQRELLVREGTARFADTVGANDHQMQKILQKHSENSRAISYGTIPYLGTFLTDLTMIDTAIGDVLPDGLINFDKRRKEFEVLAQIKLLQGAANAYQIEKQEHFVRWFESVLLLDERQAFELSCQIELQPPNITNNSSSSNEKYSSSTNNNNNYSSSANSAARENKYKKKQANGNFHHRKNDSIASTASSSSGSQFYYDTDTPSLHSNPVATGDKTKNEGTNTNNKEFSSTLNNDILEEDDDESNACEESTDQVPEKQNDGISRRGSRGSYLSSVSSSCGSCSLDASLASSSNVARSEPTAHSTPLRKHIKPSSTKSAGAESDSKTTGKSSENQTGDIRSACSGSSAARKASQVPTTTESPYKTSEFYIIRVSIESSGPETEGVIMYKSIMVSNHERTGAVIRSAMMKHGLEGSPDNYTLSQCLPSEKELLIPAKANVYYAINTQHDLNFILKEKENIDKDDFLTSSFQSPPGGSLFDKLNDNSSAYGATPKGTRKPARDTSKARRKLLGLTL